MNPITIPNIAIPVIGLPTIGIPPVGFPSASGGGLAWPAGLKESIKAIYDPAKQGMTNYDVIEAYAEDFTYWTLDNTGITSTQKKIVIPAGTELEYIIAFRGFNSFTAGFDIKYTGNAVITYRYNKEDGTVGTITIDKSGIYHLPASVRTQKNFGFYCNPQTVTEEATIEQLPTSILKDLSGNGNHAYLYGGKGKLNSGMGVYTYDYNYDRWSSTGRADYIITKKGFEFTNIIEDGGIIFALGSNIAKEGDKVKVKISGIPNGGMVYFGTWIKATEDGEYLGTYAYDNNGNTTIGTLGCIGATITLEFIPDYPDQLCYDGKMYAVCYGFPILEDYTVMADRTWFSFDKRGAFSSKSTVSNTGAFIFEFNELGQKTFSYGKLNSLSGFVTGITYQTKNSYNKEAIKEGNITDTDELIIGAVRVGDFGGYVGCHGTIIVADRSFTEEEINWLKNNLFTIDIPTPAYDFDFSKYKDGSNLGDSITDKYGNVLELHNFAWKGMSGLGGYINFPTTGNLSAASWIYDNQSITFTEIINPIASQVYTWGNNLEEIPSTKVNIIGLNNYKGAFILYRYWNGNALIVREIYNDGEYILEKGESYNNESHLGINWGIAVMNHTGKCNIKVNILPIYLGTLVFDGIDDYAKLAKMTIKTVIIDFVNLELDKQVYDNRDKPNNHNYFSIYPQADTIAYEARNSDGKTYIDGELNTTIKTNDLLGVRCITCASNDLAKETEQYISKDSLLNNFYGKMALYRITGFTEVLTPDQVWKWYQKNQPKGGDK